MRAAISEQDLAALGCFAPDPIKPKRNKYSAIKVKIDGITFDSKKEARRYVELKVILKQNGTSEGLKVHPRFALKVGDRIIGYYEAGFSYWFDRNPKAKISQVDFIVEDVKAIDRKTGKPLITELAKWKIRHF